MNLVWVPRQSLLASSEYSDLKFAGASLTSILAPQS